MRIFIILLAILIKSNLTFANIISDYKAINLTVKDKGKIYVAIRSYKLNGKKYLLIVDPNNLKTYQKLYTSVNHTKSSFKNTGYYSALKKYILPPYENNIYGIKNATHISDGVFLTIDMCPSRKIFEKEFFELLIKIAIKQNKPIPIAIAISTKWVLSHKDEFKWILNQKWLDITWVNHSDTHFYDKNLKDEDNFLNSKNTDIINEILNPEKMLLSYGLTPSVFFRFPGLVSSYKLLKIINNFGLLPLSANAWLAKGQIPKPGSIILVHGNSNEHYGIEKFIDWMHNNKLQFISLNQVISDIYE